MKEIFGREILRYSDSVQVLRVYITTGQPFTESRIKLDYSIGSGRVENSMIQVFRIGYTGGSSYNLGSYLDRS